MCGILCVFGVVRGAETIKDRVLERARRIRHRGPDWTGVYCKGKNILAHERLAIVDPEGGAQPLFNEEKSIVLAVNGEIYNHKKLRAGLKDSSKFMTESDCEVVLHLYEEHGIAGVAEFLNQLNGIFGFCLLDEKTGNYIVARDHEGIIPLYYGHDKDGAMWVASELKGLHDICVSFTDFPPGHFYDSAKGELFKWYNPKWHDPLLVPTNDVDLKELREQFEGAVTRQLMSDVPFGVLLSGGLDSSVVAAIAARHSKKRVEEEKAKEKPTTGWPQLHSFCIGLEGSPDLAAAKKVADYIDTVHHSFTFTVEEGLHALKDVIYHLETYDVTTCRAATPMYLMARKIKSFGVKMVLSGEGADEMFGGYLYFHKCPDDKEFQKESVQKVKGLYKFDCLRANKSLAAWGVEGRVPFLDKEFLDYAMTISPKDKMCGKNGGGRIEKHILREAFKGYIPEEILWRQKEQFSDGVGYSWIDSIKAHAEQSISDHDFQNAKHRFPHNTPPTKEAYLIRQCFEDHFPERSAVEGVPGGPSIACSTAAAIMWDKSFQQLADCSGRSVAGVHDSAYDSSSRSKLNEAGGGADEKSATSAEMEFCSFDKSTKADTKEGKRKPEAAEKAGSTKKQK